MDVEEHPEGPEGGALNVVEYAVLEGAELGDLQEVTRLVDQYPDLVHTQVSNGPLPDVRICHEAAHAWSCGI